MVALRARTSPADVVMTLMGVFPEHVVIPWEDATVGGFAATRVLASSDRRVLDAQIPALWPTGPIALAAAAAKVLAGLAGQSRATTCCFIAPDDHAGIRARAAALPARLGPAGITRAELPDLSAHDRIALDNATLL
jgi:hypothetical protein